MKSKICNSGKGGPNFCGRNTPCDIHPRDPDEVDDDNRHYCVVHNADAKVICSVVEDDNGEFFCSVRISETEQAMFPVNYCVMCGTKAPTSAATMQQESN